MKASSYGDGEARGAYRRDFTGDFVKLCACPIVQSGLGQGENTGTREWFLPSKKWPQRATIGAEACAVPSEPSRREGMLGLVLRLSHAAISSEPLGESYKLRVERKPDLMRA